MDAFVGEVRIFGFNFAPYSWAFCNGAILPISQYAALFSLIGTYFGGNGSTNFALPNLQGSNPLGVGSGPGLTPRTLGEQVGSRTVTLLAAQSAIHNHSLQVFEEGPITTTTDTPGPTVGVSRLISVPAGGGHATVKTVLSAGPPNTTRSPASAVSLAGGGQAHDNNQPWLATNFCICLSGTFPTRS